MARYGKTFKDRAVARCSACEVAGIDPRTLQRWKATAGLSDGDGWPRAARPLPAHALSPQEREQILKLSNEPRFAELPPARIVPMLADEGTYRQRVQLRPCAQSARSDATWGAIENSSAQTAAEYAHRHGTSTGRVTGQWFYIDRSIPPTALLTSIMHVAGPAGQFVRWYNHDHRHSGSYVSPAERHSGDDRNILAHRHELYEQGRAARPRRWARHTRNWQPIAAVTLNPEREDVVGAALDQEKKAGIRRMSQAATTLTRTEAGTADVKLSRLKAQS